MTTRHAQALNEYNETTRQFEALGHYVNADDDDVAAVLMQPTGTGDGRSKFMWIRLRNGDLILGVFPEGDTYMTYEEKYP